MGGGRESSQLTKFRRRQPENIAENARKMKGIVKAGFMSRLFYQNAVLLQPFGSVVHFETQQILIGRLLVVAAKEATQIS